MILRKVTGKGGRASGVQIAIGRGSFAMFGDGLRLAVSNVDGESYLMTAEERDVIEMVRLLRRADNDGRVSVALHQALTDRMRG